MRVRTNVVETYIYPVITYGLECVTWTKALENKMNVFQNKIMRFLINKSVMDKISIETLKEMTGIKSIFEIIKGNKINLFKKAEAKLGGTLKACVEGVVQGKRSRGKPKKRWLDDIRTWLDTERHQIVENLDKV